jgi:hypothetical protein
MRLTRFIFESPRSDAHEEAIADGFRGRIIPDDLPKWMIELGIAPGAKVVKSIVTGGSGIKPDVIVTFDKGSTLRISAKLSNADFFGNWYTKRKVKQDLGENAVAPISEEVLEFSKRWKDKKGDKPFVGVSIAFGKRGGETGKPFTNLFPVDLIKRIVAGGSPHAETNANALYATDTVPQSVISTIKNLQPISNSVIKKLSKDFNLIFRPVYTPTNKSNMKKSAWSQLVANGKFKEPINITTQSELLKYTQWVQTPLDKDIKHFEIVRELNRNNIFVPLK